MAIAYRYSMNDLATSLATYKNAMGRYSNLKRAISLSMGIDTLFSVDVDRAVRIARKSTDPDLIMCCESLDLVWAEMRESFDAYSAEMVSQELDAVCYFRDFGFSRIVTPSDFQSVSMDESIDIETLIDHRS